MNLVQQKAQYRRNMARNKLRNMENLAGRKADVSEIKSSKLENILCVDIFKRDVQYKIKISGKLFHHCSLTRNATMEITYLFPKTMISWMTNFVLQKCLMVISLLYRWVFAPKTVSLKRINSRNATGYDNIPEKIIRIGSSELSYPLRHLINTSISPKSFPCTMKYVEIMQGLCKDYTSPNEDILRNTGISTLLLNRLKCLLLETFKTTRIINAECLHGILKTHVVPYDPRTTNLVQPKL